MLRRVAIAVAAASLTSSAVSAQQVGFIVDLSGRWTIASPRGETREAARSATLEDRDELRKLDRDATAYVIVALYTGSVQKYETTTTVSGPPAPSARERIMRAIQQRFQTGFVSGSVRGEAFKDAVLKASASGIDVSAVFAGTPPGIYRVVAHPIVDGRVVATVRAAGRVEVASGHSSALPSVPPGPYQLDVSNDRTGSAAGSAWVRVVSEAEYPAAAAAFAEIAAVPSGADPDLRRAMRRTSRACLMVIDGDAQTR